MHAPRASIRGLLVIIAILAVDLAALVTWNAPGSWRAWNRKVLLEMLPAFNVLAVTLSNINPIAHTAMALANFTRIERGEPWPQYHYLTPAVARLIGAMDAERQAVAAAFGLKAASIEAHFQRSFDVPQTTLAEIAAELHRRRGGPLGPASLDTRFVHEDVPYGLAFNAALARIAGVAVPVTDATITTLSTLYGRALGDENPLVAALRLSSATSETLLARCARLPATT